MRPGAWLVPFWVWQLLQSPFGGDATIARRLPLATTATRIGNVTGDEVVKFPAVLTGSVITLPLASATSTAADVPP